MPYKIAIASGKGGTGKTTVSINLFNYITKNFCDKVQLVDCDVEEPNDLIFFPEASLVKEENIYQRIPVINTGKCTFCRACAEYCEFNAIVVIPPVQFAEVNDGLCHSCGACLVACDQDAIVERDKLIGKISTFDIARSNGVVEGRLEIGSAMQTMLIREVKKNLSDDNEIILFDAPPGSSCPVVETISDTDYVILVTEPTPFGLHDLKIMVDVMEDIQKPFGVIINKAGLGNNELYMYLENKNIEIIGEIPFRKDYATKYANGTLLGEIPREIKTSYNKIMHNLERRLLIYEGDNYFKW